MFSGTLNGTGRYSICPLRLAQVTDQKIDRYTDEDRANQPDTVTGNGLRDDFPLAAEDVTQATVEHKPG